MKERFFGLTDPQGNHGEDVKELYFFKDNTPWHSYMRMIYRYPLAAFPYEEFVRRNAERSKMEPELNFGTRVSCAETAFSTSRWNTPRRPRATF